MNEVKNVKKGKRTLAHNVGEVNGDGVAINPQEMQEVTFIAVDEVTTERVVSVQTLLERYVMLADAIERYIVESNDLLDDIDEINKATNVDIKIKKADLPPRLSVTKS